ncbi:hypothetical protein I6E06_03870 [Bifidobacterium boum]|uniref:Spy0128 family protein n=1 Tax=Bifidobacterium boum TaxID=78343 RepID=UPI001F304AA8|nr:FctA domain-containing protein [Bifidobacterium boum]MCF2561613.1 hypothetical protein [Bifidobacterium boum]
MARLERFTRGVEAPRLRAVPRRGLGMSRVPGMPGTSGTPGVARRASVAVGARKIIAAIVVTLFVCIPLVAVSPVGVHPAYAADTSSGTSADASDNGMSISLFDYSGPNERVQERQDWDWTYKLTKPSINDNGHAMKFGDVSGTSKRRWDGYVFDTACQHSRPNHDWNCWTGRPDEPVHAGIVENALGSDGYPTLNQNVTGSTESLGYLFGGSSDAAVTAYPVVGGFLKRGADGYYQFDSRTQYARYDRATQRMTLTDGARGNSSSVPNFTPFNDMSDRDYDYEFGMSVSGELYMPAGGKINGKDMIFDFSGDDDVWVFLDGALALDLGGIHGDRHGTINFTTGNITYDQSDSRWWTVTRATTLSEAFSRVGKTWDPTPYKKHTLSLFYLERGRGGSNCFMRFNMPTLPTGTIELAKSVVFGDAVPVDDTTFRFAVFIDYNPEDSTKHERFTGTYDIIDSTGTRIASDVSAADGVVRLSDGQIARLKAPPGKTIHVTSTYYVTELGDWSASYDTTAQGKALTRNTLGLTTPLYEVKDVPHVEFDNAVKPADLFDATIDKQCDNCPADARFTLLATIGTTPFAGSYDLVAADGSTKRLATTNGLITLVAGQKAVIRNIVGGNRVTVREVNADGEAFEEDTFLAPDYAMGGGALTGTATVPSDGGITGTTKRAPELGAGDNLAITVTNHAKTVTIVNFPTTRVIVAGTGGWADGDTFDIQLTPVTADGATEAYGSTPMPSSCADATAGHPCRVTIAKGNDSTGTAAFGSVTFTTPGTYTYRVTQIADSGAHQSSYSYSQAEYLVTVTVSATDKTTAALNADITMQRTADDLGQGTSDTIASMHGTTDTSTAILDFTNTNIKATALPLAGSRAGLGNLICVISLLLAALALGGVLAFVERRNRDA